MAEPDPRLALALRGDGRGRVGALIKTGRWAELPIANLLVTVAAMGGWSVGLKLAWTW